MPTAPGFADCSYELRHASLSRSAYLTFGVDPSGTDPTAVAAQLSASFAVAGSLASILDNNVTMQRVRVSLGTDGGEDLVGVFPTNVVCTRTLSSPPPNCAVLVHKQSARGGRRGRGRMYIPWACAGPNITEAGALLAADMTLVQNAIGVWSASVAAGAGPVVLLHRPSRPGTVRPTTPGPPNVVTSYNVDATIATQRRRLGR